MPEAIIEYLDGTKKRYDFFCGGEFMAAEKAAQLLAKEGHLAKRIYTTDWENDVSDSFK